MHRRLEQASDPFIIIDGNGAVVWSNRAAAQLFDLSSGTLTPSIDDASLAAIVAVNLSEAVKLSVHLKSGETQPFTAIVIDSSPADPRARAFLICFKQAAVRLQGSLEHHREQLSTVAHDLKNPLGAIFGFADALLDTDSGRGLSDLQREVLARIRAIALRCSDMVRNLQLLTQLEDPFSRNAPLACDLNAVVSGVVDQTYRGGPGVPVLSLQLAAGQLIIYTDRSQLERVVGNLFSNALRYTPPAGAILVKTGKADQMCEFFIKNTRSFIPAEEIQDLFRKYVRASTGVSMTGSGLGLYITKRIVDTWGGSIEVQSSQDEGTSFRVRFPVGKPGKLLDGLR